MGLLESIQHPADMRATKDINKTIPAHFLF